jgi:hypothetical protein
MNLLGDHYTNPILRCFAGERYYKAMGPIDLVSAILHSGEIPALQKPLGLSKTIPHDSLNNSNYA